MTTYPNSWIITTSKPTSKCTAEFTVLMRGDMFEAMRTLTPSGFKLWVYMMSNKDGYTFALSKADVVTKTGMSPDAYKDARKELVKKGYLVKTGKNQYRVGNKPMTDCEPETEPMGENPPNVGGEITPNKGENPPDIGGEITPEIEKHREYIENHREYKGDNGPSVYDSLPISGDSILPDGEDGVDVPTEEYAEIKPVHSGRKTVRWLYDVHAKEKRARDSEIWREYNDLISDHWQDWGNRDKLLDLIKARNPFLSALWKNKNHGVRVDGWDEEKNEPQTTTALFFVPPKVMKQKVGVITDVYNRERAVHEELAAQKKERTPVVDGGSKPIFGERLTTPATVEYSAEIGSAEWWEEISKRGKSDNGNNFTKIETERFVDMEEDDGGLPF